MSSTFTGADDLDDLAPATSFSMDRGTAVQPCSSTVFDIFNRSDIYWSPQIRRKLESHM